MSGVALSHNRGISKCCRVDELLKLSRGTILKMEGSNWKYLEFLVFGEAATISGL